MKLRALALAVLSAGPLLGAAQSPQAPSLSAAVVPAAPEHFTEAFADPVDYANPEDQLLIPPATQGTSPRMEAGQLRWERQGTMDVAVVFAGYAPSAFAAAGREGIAAPVDAGRYTTASFRLYSANATALALLWDRCGPDRGRCVGTSATVRVAPGWNTYTIPLRAESGEPWAGAVVEVRLTVAGDGSPVPTALDWFRLHAPGDGVDVSYPSGTLYWDGDDDRANNTPDNPNWGVVGTGGGTATFPAASYPDGTYRFHADSGPSSAPLLVGSPVPDFAQPDAEGGADYAATVRGDAWDFDQPSDVAAFGNAADLRFDAGVLTAVNAGPDPGDPFVFLAMGPPIDTARFHRVTVRASLDGAFDLGPAPGGGAHGRLLWDLGTDPAPRPLYDSKELVVYPGVGEYVVDLATVPPSEAIDTSAASRPGWVGTVPRLRYDPNEDPGARRWSIDEIAVRADDETVDDVFDILWRDASSQSGVPATVALFADTDRAGFDGRLIAADLEQRPGENRYRWDTRDWPAGRYHVYAEIQRDGVVGRRYAGGPVVVGARLAGPDRIGTAIELAQAAYPETATAVVVASGADFPDALAAAPLAAAAGGPLLLNDRDQLAPAVAAEIERMAPATVYLLGGEAAQSSAVQAALAAQGVEVVRVAGANRYATAAAAAQAAAERWGGGSSVLVASGVDFPDALAAAPLATARRAPLLLTDPNAVPGETAAALEELGATDVTVVGGPAAVSDATAARLGAGRRLGGVNRHATAVALANEAVAAGADPDDVLVAAARQFPDALAAGPVAAARGGVLLLSERDTLPPETAAFLRSRAPTLTWLRVAGGPAALAEPVVRVLLGEAGR